MINPYRYGTKEQIVKRALYVRDQLIKQGLDNEALIIDHLLEIIQYEGEVRKSSPENPAQ